MGEGRSEQRSRETEERSEERRDLEDEPDLAHCTSSAANGNIKAPWCASPAPLKAMDERRWRRERRPWSDGERVDGCIWEAANVRSRRQAAARPPRSVRRTRNSPLLHVRRGRGLAFWARSCFVDDDRDARKMATSSNDAAPADESGSATFRLELMHILENLKTTKRTGWVREGVKDPESCV